MIRLVLFFLIIVLAAFGFSWLADNPGTVTINWDWLGRNVELSLLGGVLVVLAILVAGIVVWRVIRIVMKSPQIMSGYFSARKRDKGYKALSQGMIAVGAGDARKAQEFAKKSAKLLRNEPMTQLLKAQAAQLSNNSEATRDAFDSMLEDPQTKLLGLRGLYLEARKEDEVEAARFYAEKAVEASPSAPWASNAVFEFQCSDGDWESALRSLQRLVDVKLIDRPTFRRRRAVLLTGLAMEMEPGDPARAKSLSLEAHRLAPDLVPAAVVAGRLLIRNGEIRKAVRMLESVWKRTPHPDIADVYVHARPGDSAQDRLKRARTLAARGGHTVEGKYALAQAAIDAKEWGEAQKALDALVRDNPTTRTCLLMADFVEAESGDVGGVREWLSRALKATRDPTWTADGITSDEWAPISPVTRRLDAFVWKVPVEAIGPNIDILESLTAEDAVAEGKMIAVSPGPAKPEDATGAIAAKADEPKPAKAAEPSGKKSDDAVQGANTPSDETGPATGTKTDSKTAPSMVAESDKPAPDAGSQDNAESEKEAARKPSASSSTNEAKSINGDAAKSNGASRTENDGGESNQDKDAKEGDAAVELHQMPDDPGTNDGKKDEPTKRFRLF